MGRQHVLSNVSIFLAAVAYLAHLPMNFQLVLDSFAAD